MTNSTCSFCPNCHSRTVTWQNTLEGLLYAIFCFPCGIYCCLRRRLQHCSKCDCDVIKSSRTHPMNTLGYSFRTYHTMEDEISHVKETSYRNAALSSSSASSHESAGNPSNSQTELIRPS
ncbi:hypothetical protein DICVIV_06334 [Dictyocaulus viviparus]|uniref:Uncharacterized protein n=1 Tax=Dictyocaulus viviparus TaxID=29172 RepID=A0A0D8XUS2_DICVI|nr:hypothetical protein DICVIV_06334 [Dictyocaulus viviparus]